MVAPGFNHEPLHLILELNINNSKTHSENLMPLIDELFNKSNIQLSDIDLIGVDNGPGSFTGIRIGISTVKGLAAPNNIPIVPVSSLEALSYNVAPNTGYICSLIDARNYQIYCGIFDSEHNSCADYIADDIKNVMPIINAYKDIIIVKDDTCIHAENIGIAAYKKYQNGFYETADSVVPEYLKAPQAERVKQCTMYGKE